MRRRRIGIGFGVLVALSPCGVGAEAWLGADVSRLPVLEASGAEYRLAPGGDANDAVSLLAGQGVDLFRLRIWHSPPPGEASSAADAIHLARRAREQGAALLLDLHYSDTWADPGRQTPPAAWAGLPLPVLQDSVFAYTRDVVAAIREVAGPPEFVQLGNEISHGFLWPEGRVHRGGPEEYARLGLLLGAARAGVKAASPGPEPRIVLHFDNGGDADGTARFVEGVLAAGVSFDVLGLSYYPWWHGGLVDLERNLRNVATVYDLPVLVVETAYPWTLRWFDHTHNLVGEERQLLRAWPATPETQARFLRRVRRMVADTPGGLGVVWWAPEWIAAAGAPGSPVENLGWFDQAGVALPALTGSSRR